MVYRVGEGCQCCGTCIDICPIGCAKITERGAWIDERGCAGCGGCAAACPVQVIRPVLAQGELRSFHVK
jgi:ferredoxin